VEQVSYDGSPCVRYLGGPVGTSEVTRAQSLDMGAMAGRGAK
jgi:hypothetical protein